MRKDFSMNRYNVILNFSNSYCKTSNELLSSSTFETILNRYIESLKKSDQLLYEQMTEIITKEKLSATLIRLFKILMIFNDENIESLGGLQCDNLLDNKELVYEFIEGLYAYWRSIERYALIWKHETSNGIEDTNFIEANNRFQNLVLYVYRTIEETLLGTTNNVYRQLKAGVNAGVVITGKTSNFSGEYSQLNDVPIISNVVLNSPFIMKTDSNKRSGYFEEVNAFPYSNLLVEPDELFMIPIYVGPYLTYVYFHKDYFNLGLALANLFEIAVLDDSSEPELCYVFGIPHPDQKKHIDYYKDPKTGIYFGYASNVDEIDYFGYMKKMLLTLHNVRQIDHGALPIHGAMVNITFKNGVSKNIAIMGDSGAGKSESLEAFRKISKEYLKDMKIIFDDMGVFKKKGDKIVANGTEIGAFVRLDDLDFSYAFSVIERALFMNIDQVNARVIIPVTTYEYIMKDHVVDYFFYANNYKNTEDYLSFFSSLDIAKEVFTKGVRKAKGTTTEVGLVSSFFANPFGCYQQQDDTNVLINTVFDLLETHAEIGELYTQLAVDGLETEGPLKAAKALFEILKKQKSS
jgi:hypothetical protein